MENKAGGGFDWCNNFRDWGAGGLWGCFMGLVLWIAIHVRLLDDISAYVDDNFGFEDEEKMAIYVDKDGNMYLLPEKQVKLLELWDKLGVPHDPPKHLFGPILTIIGFEVNANAMTIYMSPSSHSELITAVKFFATPKQCHILYWQLISGKNDSNAQIWISVDMCRELEWMIGHMKGMEGIWMLESKEWNDEDADIVLYCDTCPSGLGFWVHLDSVTLGFQHRINNASPGIFFSEALSVLSALNFAMGSSNLPPQCVCIFTDNTNTINIFNKLKATPSYNPILITAVNLLLKYHTQLWVYHIPGDQNHISTTPRNHYFPF
ncbi:hypothetical protein D9758_008949 [Tetrapyrgos nigripes]|uniref:Uncharacterized protein n=1 Tax=Tetrapyrgos nigripes TaxID=182062 RepID=A0A8H5LQR6_9AGAR|nr:hypothetical protein D9758_008949 [Tetrapyrgos nigripes]